MPSTEITLTLALMLCVPALIGLTLSYFKERTKHDKAKAYNRTLEQLLEEQCSKIKETTSQRDMLNQHLDFEKRRNTALTQSVKQLQLDCAIMKTHVPKRAPINAILAKAREEAKSGKTETKSVGQAKGSKGRKG